MRQDVQQLLIELYRHTVNWQTKHGRTVSLTQEQFNSLWSRYRIAKLKSVLDDGTEALSSYLDNPNTKPVCGWTNRGELDTGNMNIGNAKIEMAMDQRKRFQFRKGDVHSDETKTKMRKPKTAKTIKKMKAAATARWATYRANKELNK
jgi:hypothetical protein